MVVQSSFQGASPENRHTSNIIRNEQVVFRNVLVYKHTYASYTYIHVKTMRKEGINLNTYIFYILDCESSL